MKFKPQEIDYDEESSDLDGLSATGGKGSESWLASNFRIKIGDLPTLRVSKIDSFTWKQNFASFGD